MHENHSRRWVLITICSLLPWTLASAQSVRPVETAILDSTTVVGKLSAISAIDAPYEFSFQGFLEDNGAPADGTYDFVFRLKDFATAGLTKWTESQSGVQVTDGLYNVLLGSQTSLASVDFDDDLWLEVQVNGASGILPRPKIVGTPYSFMSFEALDLRLPASISGTADVDGNKLLTITNNGTGDVLRIQGNSASDGIEVSGVDLNGVEVLSVGGTAFYASGAGGDGVFVSSTGGYAFQFRDTPDDINGNLLTSYVGIIENTGNTTSEDVLAVKTGTGGDPGAAANLIGFFDNEDDLIGQIEGNGSGGVAYTTTGADYAEFLPHMNDGDSFEPGDIVGVYDGTISHHTGGANQVMVITNQAALLGNMPKGSDVADGFESVSFIGQVPVRVQGPVKDGDYIVDSGANDGLGVAVSRENITLDQVSKVVGRSWETSDDASVHRVNIVVGLDRTEILSSIIERQSDLIEAQRRDFETLKALLETHLREDAGS